MDPGLRNLALRVGLIQTSYNIWINGERVGAGGIVGQRSETADPQAEVQIYRFAGTSDTIELIVQVANYFQSRGGIRDHPTLGTADQIIKQQSRMTAFDLTVFGCLLFMGLYLIVLYTFRREDKSPLYFGIVCLLMAVSSVIHGLADGAFYTFGIFNPSYATHTKLAYFCVTLGLPFLMLFLYELFPREWSKRTLRLILYGLFLLHGLLVFLPIRLFCDYVLVLEVVCLIASVYMGYVCAKAILHKNEGAQFLAIGIGLTFLSAFYDFLIENGILHGPQLSNISILVCTFLISALISWRFSKAFSAVKSLSEELTQANIELSGMDKIKDEFLANTSHELRTPLNGIIGIAESLIHGAAGKLPEKAIANLSMIFSSSKRLAGLVSDILDFSRLKDKDIQLAKRPIDINSLTDLVLSVCSGLVGNKPVKLVKDIPPVEGDENRLQQILYNLIGNAIKFTDRGEIRVAAIQMDSMIRVSVSDTGIGIPEGEFEGIFQAFEQEDSTSSRAYDGTGLGLSITRQLVELHGGEIRVESEVGLGSTVYFTIPVRDELPEEDNLPVVSRVVNDTSIDGNVLLPTTEKPKLTARATPSSNREPYQILVVDDDPVNLQVVANHLLLENISFQTALDGAAALARIESGQTPHVVLLDIMMPKITGYEVCRKLRETFSPSELPIIMLTARTHVADLVEAYKAGANDYLSKPFSKDELVSRVRCQLDLRESYANFLEN
jgi:two-component system sensor histidine kinase ChiS